MELAVWMTLLQGPWERTSWCTMATVALVYSRPRNLDTGREAHSTLISSIVPSYPTCRHEVPPTFWDGLGLPALRVDLSFGYGCPGNHAAIPDAGI